MLKWLCVHTECIAVRVVDMLEMNLPPTGHFPATDGINSTRFDVSQKRVRNSHKTAFEQRGERLEKLFGGSGSYLTQYTANLSVAPAAYAILRHTSPTVVAA